MAAPGLLTMADLATVNRLLQSCQSTQCMLEILKSLGLDVSQLEADNEAQQRFGEGVKRAIFPDQP